MKIVSITMVKNEVDIIESFVRYHLNILDEMIILDNNSSDETLKILNNLVDEGLPIIVIKDDDGFYNQNVKLSKLLNMAIYEYNADLVCVLDVDEFITSDYCNARNILKSLDSSFYYLVKWVTYVPTSKDNDSKFIPKKITHVRDESWERFYKVIVPKEIILNYDAKLQMGSHDLDIKNFDKTKLKKIELTLKIAHFPLRSPEQCMSKVLVGWPNIISTNLEDKPWAWHWKLIYDKIRKNNSISYTDLENFAKHYALRDEESEIKIYSHPLNIDFCENIEIKYNFKYNYLDNILDNHIRIANDIKSLKKQLIMLKKEN